MKVSESHALRELLWGIAGLAAQADIEEKSQESETRI